MLNLIVKIEHYLTSIFLFAIPLLRLQGKKDIFTPLAERERQREKHNFLQNITFFLLQSLCPPHHMIKFISQLLQICFQSPLPSTLCTSSLLKLRGQPSYRQQKGKSREVKQANPLRHVLFLSFPIYFFYKLECKKMAILLREIYFLLLLM